MGEGFKKEGNESGWHKVYLVVISILISLIAGLYYFTEYYK